MVYIYSVLSIERERERERVGGGTMNSSSSGSAPKYVETTSRLQMSFSRRISSSKLAISGGAPTCTKRRPFLYILVLASLASTHKRALNRSSDPFPQRNCRQRRPFLVFLSFLISPFIFGESFKTKRKPKKEKQN
jgi:hypothetical protein